MTGHHRHRARRVGGEWFERVGIGERRIVDDDAMGLHGLSHRLFDRGGSGSGSPELLRLTEALRDRSGARAVGGGEIGVP